MLGDKLPGRRPPTESQTLHGGHAKGMAEELLVQFPFLPSMVMSSFATSPASPMVMNQVSDQCHYHSSIPGEHESEVIFSPLGVVKFHQAP